MIMKNLSLIVAYNKDKLIGNGNKLPWRLKTDLIYFKEKTLGKTLIMGRKTFESLPKKLVDRDILILTRDNNYFIDDKDTTVFHNVEDILEYIKNKDTFIIGGREIYSLFLPYVFNLYITEINNSCEGDVYFPEWDMSSYLETSRLENEENGTRFDFVKYTKEL